MTWNDQFLALFDRCVTKYRSGDTAFEGYYTPADLALLNSIGYQPREFFDFIEDFCDEGVPTPSTALLIAGVRRDYFQTIQKGGSSHERLTHDNVPGFGEEIEGIPYLPRILAKAKAKLRGELDPDMMFSCGGDRNFLQNHGNIHPADFLRHVWAEGDHPEKLVAWVKSQG